MVEKLTTQKETIEEETVVKDEPVAAVDVDEAVVARNKRRVLILWVTGLVVVIVGLLVAAAVLAFVGISRDSSARPTFGDGSRGFARSFGGDSQFGYGTSVQTSATNNTVTTTVYTELTGVVTAVNDGSIVVAGNGTTETITTNSSTVYDNSVKPAVNDTVTIVGTTSGSTTTATEIGVNNN
jgi:hypothetical protein